MVLHIFFITLLLPSPKEDYLYQGYITNENYDVVSLTIFQQSEGATISECKKEMYVSGWGERNILN